MNCSLLILAWSNETPCKRTGGPDLLELQHTAPVAGGEEGGGLLDGVQHLVGILAQLEWTEGGAG